MTCIDTAKRGLVPTIEFSNGVIEDEIVTESAIVAQFLCDTRPSHLLPGLSDPKSPLVRARINYFTDTWNGKIGSYNFAVLKLDDDAEKETKCKEWFEAIKRDIEPQLKDCNPFFGGSTKMTLAEVGRGNICAHLTYLQVSFLYMLTHHVRSSSPHSSSAPTPYPTTAR